MRALVFILLIFSIKSKYLDFLLNCCTFAFITFPVGIDCSEISEGRILSMYYEGQTIPDAKFYWMLNSINIFMTMSTEIIF